MIRPESVLFAARDAGAAAAIAPLARATIDRTSHAAVVVAHGKAASVFEHAGLPVLAMEEEPRPERLDALLTRERVRSVVTGTSMKPQRDRLFWDAAARARVPSLGVLDHWTHYAERFTQRSPFDTLPDMVAVMDDVAREALVEAGCPPERVTVSGQPYFDDLLARLARLDRNEVRRELGIDPDRRVVVFASEPQERYFGRALGYNENESLKAAASALRRLDAEALLVVKLHPLHDDAAHASAPEDFEGLEVRVLRAYPTTHLVAAADLVLGMTSVFLLEAATAGRPTLSIRPGGDPEDHFLSRHSGAIMSVTDANEVEAAIDRALKGQIVPSATADVGRGAVERVLALVEDMVGRVDGTVGSRR